MKDFPAIPFLGNPAPVVGVIRLDGVIGRMGPIYRGLTLAALADSLERAFRLRHLKAVALAINSPGGSAVQSSLIAGRIRDLADEHDVPVYAFAEDVAASGGYWLALAADEIYADGNSIIGSIGVVSSGFGFTELIKRIGVERRLHTAGDKKAMLDPFSPEKPADVRHLKDLQKDIHENFTAMVRDRRGDKLKADDKKLFSGAFWTGPRALEMGLIDGLGTNQNAVEEAADLAALRNYEVLNINEELGITLFRFPFFVNASSLPRTDTKPIHYYLYLRPEE